MPACRVNYFSKIDKHFWKFGHLFREIFTRAHVKNSKKPRGYRIFSNFSFDSPFATDLQVVIKSLCAFASSQKINKKSLQL
jgi:hypothetical protein